jgi:hypothetical protein
LKDTNLDGMIKLKGILRMTIGKCGVDKSGSTTKNSGVLF